MPHTLGVATAADVPLAVVSAVRQTAPCTSGGRATARGRFPPAACLGQLPHATSSWLRPWLFAYSVRLVHNSQWSVHFCLRSWVDGLVLRAGWVCTAAVEQGALHADDQLAVNADDIVSILMLLEQGRGLGWHARNMGLAALAGQAVQQLTVRVTHGTLSVASVASQFFKTTWSSLCGGVLAQDTFMRVVQKLRSLSGGSLQHQEICTPVALLAPFCTLSFGRTHSLGSVACHAPCCW